jgi:hypothetical protein
VVRVPAGEPEVNPVVGIVTEPGVAVLGDVRVPVQPAKTRVQQRSTIIITMILNFIPENASRCYIMLALLSVPCPNKIVEKNFALFCEIDTI